jgi:hypothetical protein
MKKALWFLVISCVVSSCSNDNSAAAVPANLNFSPVFNFVTDSLDLDMANSETENSVYCTYSDIDLIDIYKEKVIKYNLNTLSQSNITHSDGTESRQLEIIGSNIYSISYFDIYKYNLNLDNILELHQFTYKGIPKTTQHNNNIIILSGKDYSFPGSGNMELLLFNTTSETYSTFTTFPNGYRMRGDGVTLNDKLYIFGGNDGITNYAEINIYDIISNNWTQQALPFGVYESFSSFYNNLIIVSGNKNSDSSGAFIGLYNPITNSFSNLNTSLDLNNISIRGITILNDEIYIAYTDYITPWSNNITIKVDKASLL